MGPATPRRLLLGGALLLLAGCVAGSEREEPADFVLFFPGQSATLDPAATAVLGAAAAVARARPHADVTVAGYADPTGTPQANQILSRLRAQAVADGLLQRGVERARIRLRARKARGGDPGVESRRVEIRIES